jgi:predicted PurR-regulated permease PerM
MRAIDPSTTRRSAATQSPNGGLGVTGVGVLVVAALYVGREVFVPVALAVLLSFVLAPLVKGLQKLRIPRSLAVIIVVLIAFAALLTVTIAMVSQATQLASQLPTYQTTMREKIAALKDTSPESGVLGRAADVLQDLGKELDRPKAEGGLP